MNEDTIVEEVRKVREEYFKRFNYDLDAMFDDIEKRQLKESREVISFSPKKLDVAAASWNTEDK